MLAKVKNKNITENIGIVFTMFSTPVTLVIILQVGVTGDKSYSALLCVSSAGG